MAYLFGRVYRSDGPERDNLTPKVGYLRQAKRSNDPLHASTRIRRQRLFGGQRRHH